MTRSPNSRPKGVDLLASGICSKQINGNRSAKIKYPRFSNFDYPGVHMGIFIHLIYYAIAIALRSRISKVFLCTLPIRPMYSSLMKASQIVNPRINAKPEKIINKDAEKEAPRRQFAFTARLKFKPQRFETIDINPWRPRKNQDHPGGNRDVAAILLRGH